jgi:predicted DNA-binding protein
VIRTSFRLSTDLLRRLDAIADLLSKRQVGKVTRADVLRLLLEKGLTLKERSLRREVKGRRRLPKR